MVWHMELQAYRHHLIRSDSKQKYIYNQGQKRLCNPEDILLELLYHNTLVLQAGNKKKYHIKQVVYL